jgi:hypothetical protein
VTGPTKKGRTRTRLSTKKLERYETNMMALRMEAAGQSETLVNIRPHKDRYKNVVIFIVTAMEAYNLINSKLTFFCLPHR